ncbi:Pycsar system effector family protein [Micromonospora sp. CPCC 206060]|uniref:Pycsar system effector family protein n=1 Tax=Micromonospora sp. CPCC 206060 TaxID=3122406 RepID=UPI002FF3A41F
MIRFADVKAAAVLAASGVLAGQLPSAHDPWARGVVLVAGVCIVLSALLALYTLVPRRQVTTVWSLHYYDHVARRYGDDREAFIDAWVKAAADEDAFERAVVGQIWTANLVAHRKFIRVTWSIRALVAGVVALAVVVIT